MSQEEQKKPSDSSDETLAHSDPQENQQLTEINIESEKTMEAYHPHGNHHNKGVKGYIFEFIMIFVAITGGFFMENIRENVIEHHKEKEYVIRLMRDLREDTTNLKNIIQWNNAQMAGLDSLSSLLEKPVSAIDPEKFIPLLTDNLNNFFVFVSRNVTMTQMKNTGGIRLIRNSDVADSIIIYYKDIEDAEIFINTTNKFLEESSREEIKFLDFNEISKTKKLNISDKNKMKELANRCYIFKMQIRAYNRYLKGFYQQGAALLNCLKREYDLKD